jgi:hypothetical protein
MNKSNKLMRLLLDMELANIRELIKKYPNDADLGEVVRMLYNK